LSGNVDLAAKTVCLLEIAPHSGFLPLLCKRLDVRRRRVRFRKRPESEQLQPPPQRRGSPATPPKVEERESLRRVEVVVEDADQLVSLELFRLVLEADEVVAERLRLCCRLRHHLVAEVDRLAPVGGHEEEQDRLAPPLLERVPKGDDVPERLRHLLAGQLQQPVVHPHPRKLAACAP